MDTAEIVEYMAFPRALAIAETGWSQNKYNWEDFKERVKAHLEILSGMGINSCKIIER
jgi:hexosaminidase